MIIKTLKRKIELSKGGKPYARVVLQFDEYRDGKGNMRWITGFGNQRTWFWKVGEDVQPDIKEEGQYLNFDFDGDRLDVYSMPATVGFVIDLFGKRAAPQISQQEADTTEDFGEQDDTNPF